MMANVVNMNQTITKMRTYSAPGKTKLQNMHDYHLVFMTITLILYQVNCLIRMQEFIKSLLIIQNPDEYIMIVALLFSIAVLSFCPLCINN